MDLIKRNLYCRYAHRWHPAKLGGWTRNYCKACKTWPKLEDPPEKHWEP